jgi:hypothetical protein
LLGWISLRVVPLWLADGSGDAPRSYAGGWAGEGIPPGVCPHVGAPTSASAAGPAPTRAPAVLPCPCACCLSPARLLSAVPEGLYPEARQAARLPSALPIPTPLLPHRPPGLCPPGSRCPCPAPARPCLHFDGLPVGPGTFDPGQCGTGVCAEGCANLGVPFLDERYDAVLGPRRRRRTWRWDCPHWFSCTEPGSPLIVGSPPSM